MALLDRNTRVDSFPSGKPTDARPVAAELYLLPVTTRVPLRFGTETLTSVTCARVRMSIEGRDGRIAHGWGETPLSIQWTWPADLSFHDREQAMLSFCRQLTQAWADFDSWGHPIESGDLFLRTVLPGLLDEFNCNRNGSARMPKLAGLVCCSPFDIALHDAYGVLHGVATYTTYNRKYMNVDLAGLLSASGEPDDVFSGKYPCDYFVPPARSLPVWHLVGACDPLDASELDGSEPDDGYPLVLTDWIDRDRLACLKVKLCGDDAQWDYDRIVRVGRIGQSRNVQHLSVDFNCTVTDPDYVNGILDRLQQEEPPVWEMILFVEQPFARELDAAPLDVHAVSARKPLFMDESAHNWTYVRRGAALGWTGVALKTCKTQTGVLLSLCWAREHGMPLMVQDLTNPMLAQIPHVLLAAYAGTILGVESNAMQFYPEASQFEARVHPGLYVRRNGHLDLSSIRGPGFGYRIDEIERPLEPAVARFGDADGHPRRALDRPHFSTRKGQPEMGQSGG